MSPADWFRAERGIEYDTLVAYNISDGDDLVKIPYPNGEKTRYFTEAGTPVPKGADKPRFRFTVGVKPDLLPPPKTTEKKVAFLVEGETDAMRLWQESGSNVYGLSGTDAWREELVSQLHGYDVVFVILDNENEYENPAGYEAVERAWLAIRRDLGRRARRLRLPIGIKDVCEFFGAYDLETLKLLARQPVSAGSRFKPLDLNKEPPPPRWLLDGLIARGDVTLLSGASGLGKSWITLGLTTAVADMHKTYLGQDVLTHGRVLVVDEENPEDVIYSRLRQLGLKSRGNVRYLWNNAIRMDRQPEILLEEALEYDPVLIVLDSLTRIHGKEENNAGEMAPLLNEAIKPLARDTGAAVVVIHHHDKAGNGPRGSGDILASMDGAIDVHGSHAPGQFTLKLSKSRRRLAGSGLTVRITDLPDGSVALKAAEPLDTPF